MIIAAPKRPNAAIGLELSKASCSGKRKQPKAPPQKEGARILPTRRRVARRGKGDLLDQMHFDTSPPQHGYCFSSSAHDRW